MKATALQRALPVVAGIIADRTGVEVKTGGVACTDGKVIYLPPLPLNLDEEDFVCAIGYIYHECGHVKDTDFSIPFASPLQRSIAQPLEDVRIEKLRMAQSPGARRYLSRLVGILTQRGLDGKPESFGPVPAGDTVSPHQAFQAYLLYKLRHDVLGQVAIKPVLDTATAAMARFPKGMRTKLEALMFEVEQCGSTSDVFALADEIIRMIEDEKEQEQQREQQQQDQSSAGADGDDGQPGGSDTSPGDDPTDDGGQGGAGDDQGDDAQGNQQQQTNEGGSDHGESDGGDQTQEATASDQTANGTGGSSVLNELLSMTDDEVTETVGEVLQKLLNQTAQKAARSGNVVSSANVHPLPLPNKQVDTSRIKRAINALRVQTMAWMSSATECDTQLVHAGMQLDYAQLHQARFGGPMFLRTEEGIDLNADISILIDRSVSMALRMQLASEAALAALLAYDIQGISTQVAVFPVAGAVAGGVDEDGVAVVKRWSESPRYLGGRIQSLTVEGTTPMAQAILWAACDLLKREEARRILLVVTDGEPDDKMATREVIDLARESGVHVIGLGIGSNTQPVFGAKCAAVINDINELAGSMVKLIKQAMSDQ